MHVQASWLFEGVDAGNSDTQQQQQNVTNDLVVTHHYFLKINVQIALPLMLTYQLFCPFAPAV